MDVAPAETDRVRKTTVLHAPQARVWAAISEAEQFGRWFGMTLDGPFVAGTRLTGQITPTTVDPEVARLQAPHAGTPFVFIVERIEPMRLFAFSWHPNAVGLDAADREPTTLVEFELEPLGEQTRLTITESGFDRVPIARRAQAFAANSEGWTHQLRLIGLYLQQTA